MKQRVNLYTIELQPLSVPYSLTTVAKSFVGFVLLFTCVLSVWNWHVRKLELQSQVQLQQISNQTVALAELQQQLLQRKPDPVLENQLVLLEQSLLRKQQILNYLQLDNPSAARSYGQLMAQLAQIDLPQFWLTEFSVGHGHTYFKGIAQEGALVPQWLARLGQLSTMQGQNFKQVELTPVEQSSYLSFSVMGGEEDKPAGVKQ